MSSHEPPEPLGVDESPVIDGTRPSATALVSDVPAETVSVKPDNRFAWGLAATPLLVGVFTLLSAAGTDVPESLLTGGGIGLAVGLGMQDAAQVRAAGARMSQGVAVLLCVLFSPIYLVLRAVRLRGGYAIPVVWFASLAASALAIVTVAPLLEGPSFDAETAESAILEEYSTTLGSIAEVSCPPVELTRLGQTERCTIETGDSDQTFVDVTLVDFDGRIRMVLLR